MKVRDAPELGVKQNEVGLFEMSPNRPSHCMYYNSIVTVPPAYSMHKQHMLPCRESHTTAGCKDASTDRAKYFVHGLYTLREPCIPEGAPLLPRSYPCLMLLAVPDKYLPYLFPPPTAAVDRSGRVGVDTGKSWLLRKQAGLLCARSDDGLQCKIQTSKKILKKMGRAPFCMKPCPSEQRRPGVSRNLSYISRGRDGGGCVVARGVGFVQRRKQQHAFRSTLVPGRRTVVIHDDILRPTSGDADPHSTLESFPPFCQGRGFFW